MQLIKLVDGLQIREVVGTTTDVEHFRLDREMCPLPIKDTEDFLLLDRHVVKERCPVHVISYSDGRPPLYIAYTQEFEDLVQIPFKAIKESQEAALRRVEELNRIAKHYRETTEAYESMGWIQRLKFLFTNRIENNK